MIVKLLEPFCHPGVSHHSCCSASHWACSAPFSRKLTSQCIQYMLADPIGLHPCPWQWLGMYVSFCCVGL